MHHEKTIYYGVFKISRERTTLALCSKKTHRDMCHLSPEITSDLGRRIHRDTPRHIPHGECGGPERRWLVANSRSMEAKSKPRTPSKSPTRSPVVGAAALRGHPGPSLKRTADLATGIGVANLRGVLASGKNLAGTEQATCAGVWPAHVPAGSHQRWAALPGRGAPRARARRDARRDLPTRGRGCAQP